VLILARVGTHPMTTREKEVGVDGVTLKASLSLSFNNTADTVHATFGPTFGGADPSGQQLWSRSSR